MGLDGRRPAVRGCAAAAHARRGGGRTVRPRRRLALRPGRSGGGGFRRVGLPQRRVPGERGVPGRARRRPHQLRPGRARPPGVGRGNGGALLGADAGPARSRPGAPPARPGRRLRAGARGPGRPAPGDRAGHLGVPGVRRAAGGAGGRGVHGGVRAERACRVGPAPGLAGGPPPCSPTDHGLTHAPASRSPPAAPLSRGGAAEVPSPSAAGRTPPRPPGPPPRRPGPRSPPRRSAASSPGPGCAGPR